MSTTAMMMYIIWIMIPVVIVGAILKKVKEQQKKKKGKTEFEIPRDINERVETNARLPFKRGMGYRGIWRARFTGDRYFMGQEGGDIIAIVPFAEEYQLWIRPRWWKFWRSPITVMVEPSFMSDFNGEEVIIEGRSIETRDKYLSYIIPTYNHSNLSEINIRRSMTCLLRTLKLADYDLNTDEDVITKFATRGDIQSAQRELDMVTDMWVKQFREIEKAQNPKTTRIQQGPMPPQQPGGK